MKRILTALVLAASPFAVVAAVFVTGALWPTAAMIGWGLLLFVGGFAAFYRTP